MNIFYWSERAFFVLASCVSTNICINTNFLKVENILLWQSQIMSKPFYSRNQYILLLVFVYNQKLFWILISCSKRSKCMSVKNFSFFFHEINSLLLKDEKIKSGINSFSFYKFCMQNKNLKTGNIFIKFNKVFATVN